MEINGIEIQQHQLSYDKILKSILEQDDGVTIQLINGMFHDHIPLDAEVVWLDKESVGDEYKAFVADFYPRINGRMYSIEVEQDDNGDMALRVFRYAMGGALHHNMKATASELNITFPQPCVVFLKSKANTPQNLTWNIEFFDGQKITLQVPVIRLSDLSLEEIALRGLLPIGQFYLRTFDPLSDNRVPEFRAAAEMLLSHLREAVERDTIPVHIGLQMQDTIRKTAENVIYKSQKEVGLTMTTNILETLPWIDYQELHRKLEERGKAVGIVEGKAEGALQAHKELAVNFFATMGRKLGLPASVKALHDLGIPDEVIETAKKEAVLDRQSRKRDDDPER